MRTAKFAALFTLVITAACGESGTLTEPAFVQFAAVELATVCHWDADTETWSAISVPNQAVNPHLSHGDGLPGDPIPNTNRSFGPDCEPVGWEVLVSEVNTSRVRLISSDGTTSSSFHVVPQPRGIAVEADGSVVLVQLTGDLRRIAPDGSSSSIFFSGLSGASGISILPNGDFVVTEDASPYRLMRVAPDGGSSSVIATGIKSEDVEVDADGNLIVLQEFGGLLLRVTPSGASTTLFSGLSSPAALAIEGNGNILVAEFGAGTVRRIAPDGSSAAVVAAGLSRLEGLAITPDGDLLVSESSLGRLTKIRPDGSTTVFFSGLAGPDHIAIRSTN